MLRELIYEMLMKATNFVRLSVFMEGFFDMERNLFGRLIVKASNLVGWILTQLILISLTGGLYLIWIGFKLIFRSMRRKHNKKQTRKNKRRA
jgi:small neutral amino acid transporter SnatA (MarC family)